MHAVIAAAHGPGARDAVAVAVDLARLHETSLVIAGVYVVPAGPYARAYEHAAREALRQELEQLCEAVPPAVPHTMVLHACSSAVRGLRELAESEQADALVVGPTHRGRLGRVIHGDVTASLLHGAPCAIAVAPRGWADGGVPLGRRVVGVAWDDSREAQMALDEACRVVQRTGAVLRLIHAVEPLPTSAELSWVDDEALAESRHERARALIDEAAADLRGRCLAETAVLDGPAAGVLGDVSEELDLLVLGSRAYGPLTRVLLGSVSTRVAHHAACPVLVVPRPADGDAGAAAGDDAARAAG
ncbi:MAG TPA: universal stress protein [Baekduia sp.]|nr:universal stress protein [Baekduia sp.]